VRKLGTLRHLCVGWRPAPGLTRAHICRIPKVVHAEKDREQQAESKVPAAAPMQEFFLVRPSASGSAEDGEVTKVVVHPGGHMGVQRRRGPQVCVAPARAG
jgi:hypothetical protein